MYTVIQILQGVVGIASLVCFILVLIRIFQDGQTGLGIACAVLSLCGIGVLITFIVGWMNAPRWGITNIMAIWTGCFVVGLILGGIGFATMPQPTVQYR